LLRHSSQSRVFGHRIIALTAKLAMSATPDVQT